MPTYEEEEEARRAREEQERQQGDGRTRGYRGDQTPGGGISGYDTPGGDRDAGVSNFDRDSSGVPIWGWLSGADARAAEQRAMNEAQTERDAFINLGISAPNAADLTPEYYMEGREDEYGDLLMGDSRLEGMTQGQQQAAMAKLEGVGGDLHQISEGGGYTAQDRAQMTAQRLRQGQALSGANAAAMQQMQARGTGGGGAELAARLGGSAAYANANAQADAAIGAAGQQRAMQALQAQGQIGQAQGSLAGQMYGQDAQRRQALDAYNQAQYDWRRGREGRNTQWQNKQQDARTDARQQAYENQERATALAYGTSPYGAGSDDRDRQDEANKGIVEGIGELVDI